MKLRSPDSMCNPYIAYALLIYAGMDGILQNMDPGQPVNRDLTEDDVTQTGSIRKLPDTLKDAQSLAQNSAFIRGILSDEYFLTF